MHKQFGRADLKGVIRKAEVDKFFRAAAEGALPPEADEEDFAAPVADLNDDL
jgi:hypothetical protein